MPATSAVATQPRPTTRRCPQCGNAFVPRLHNQVACNRYCYDRWRYVKGRKQAGLSYKPQKVARVLPPKASEEDGSPGIRPFNVVFRGDAETEAFVGEETAYFLSGHKTETSARDALERLRELRPGVRAWIEHWSADESKRTTHQDVAMKSEVVAW